MALWAAFCGGEDSVRSSNIDASACINLFRETVPSADNAKKSVLMGTPGQKLLMTASDTVCRGCYDIDGSTWAVVGATLGELNLATNTFTSRGTITNDGLPVSMVSNGRGGEQLMIVGGGEVKILNLLTKVLSAAVSLPLTNAPVMGAYIDTYFLLTEANTVRIWFSAPSNGSSWSALNFFSRSHSADNVVGIAVQHNVIRVFGSRTSEIFYDSGDATTPFLPYQGTTVEHGAVGPWAIALQGDTLLWVEKNAQGYAQIMQSAGGAPTVISTPAIAFALSSYSKISDAETLVYQQEGHAFVAFTFPAGDRTWVYDVTEGIWHQRASWDSTISTLHRWRARGCCAAGTKIITGDYLTGAIYSLDLNTFTDNGVVLPRLRRAPYVAAENQWLFLDAFELGVQSGVGLGSGQGSAPNLMLRVSRDGNHTYGPTTTATIGPQGAFNAQAIWNRLGRARSDRLVLEVSQTDPVRTVWGPGAWIRATPGTGQI